jgi:ELWxxDGT repeat protein
MSANTPKRLGNSLLFKANDGVTGDGLWKTDGTESGTVLVKNSGFSSLSLSESIVFQGNLTIPCERWIMGPLENRRYGIRHS